MPEIWVAKLSKITPSPVRFVKMNGIHDMQRKCLLLHFCCSLLYDRVYNRKQPVALFNDHWFGPVHKVHKVHMLEGGGGFGQSVWYAFINHEFAILFTYFMNGPLLINLLHVNF